MNLRIVISLENAAFEPEHGPEVARILRALADDMEQGSALTGAGDHESLRDINGNAVGKAKVTR